jgi:hypothetical protein
MPSETRFREPRWYLLPVRVLLVTAILTLLAFAVTLLLGIGGILLDARLHGMRPDLTLAYRHVAFPIALVTGAVVAISSSLVEVRHFQRAKTLARLEEQAEMGRSPR